MACRQLSKSYQVTNPSSATGLVGLAANEPGDFSIVSVINDTDIDVKVEYKSSDGNDCNFIVPKSIRCFTQALKSGVYFTPDLVIVKGIGANAVGKVTFNFAT
jgi:hypothetical protein